MKPTLLVIATCAAALCAPLHADELPWQFEYDKALESAQQQHKPVLLDFSASWCGPCRMMETTTFANPEVRAALGDYILVKVDIDRNSALAARYGVNAIPACFVLNQFGEKVDQRVGYADALTFNLWLDGAKSGAAATESKYQALAERIKKLSQVWNQPMPARAIKRWPVCWKLAARRNETIAAEPRRRKPNCAPSRKSTRSWRPDI